MPVLFYLRWNTLFEMGISTLHGTPDSSVWHSGIRTDGPPSHERLQIFYSLVFAETPIANARFDFWIARGDDAVTNPIWDGSMSSIAGQITSTGGIAAALAGLGDRIDHHDWQTGHGATFVGHFVTDNYGPSWQLVIRPIGGDIATSGSYVRYRYGAIEG